MEKTLMKIRNALFSLIVLATLVAAIVYMVFYKEVIYVSTQEKRNLATFESVKDASFQDGELQKKLNDAISDQFISRYELVNEKSRLDLMFTRLFIPPSNDEYKLNPMGDTPIKQIGNSHYLINGLMGYSEVNEQRFKTKALQINQLAADYPDIKIFVYKPNQIHETSLFDEANDTVCYGPFYNQILETTLDVPFAQLMLEDLETCKSFFYESDHHWNYQGSYQGYKDIVKLMLGEEEEVLQPVKLETFNNELLFAGTFAARTGYVFPPEYFYVFTFDLPNYVVYVDEKKAEIFNMNNVSEHLATRDGDYFYTLAYGSLDIYGCDFYMESEHTEKETLLIIGDSYAGAVEPLLMNHFSKIYFIQPLDYYWKNGEKFDYDRFIAENDVDNILFMYTVENYFYGYGQDDRYELFEIYRSGVKN